MGANVERLIGIDFGTSTSVVRVKRYQDGQPVGDSFQTGTVTFGSGESDSKAVTAVRRNPDGSLTCGVEAEDQVPDSEVFREFKMDLESADEERRRQAMELTEAYFQYLYEWYDHQRTDLGELDDRERTVVSFPVKWQEETRRFMIGAAENAGFQNVTAMDEPTAALYATLCRKMEEINRKGLLRVGEPGYLLLVDMGAGTTDLAVCRYTVSAEPGQAVRADRIKNEIVAAWPVEAGAATFGGREVDRLLEGYVAKYCMDCAVPEGISWQLARGNNATKAWKEMTVSRTLNDGGQVTTCSFVTTMVSAFQHGKPFPAFGRKEFEELLAEKLEQFKALAAGCLGRASEIEPEVLAKGLDLVILTGGHSSWYFTEELLNGTMPGLALPQLERVQREKSRVIRLSNPQETVALGLVYSQLPFQVGGEPPVRCPHCGKEIPATLSFCYYCGATVGEEEAPAAPAPGAAAAVGAQAAAPAPGACNWNDLLSAEARAFIDGYDRNFIWNVSKNTNVASMVKNFMVPNGQDVYLAHDDGILFHFGTQGFVIAEDGLYERFSGSGHYVSWEEFVKGEIGADPSWHYTCTVGGKKVFVASSTVSGTREFLLGLQSYLRQCAGMG